MISRFPACVAEAHHTAGMPALDESQIPSNFDCRRIPAVKRAEELVGRYNLGGALQ